MKAGAALTLLGVTWAVAAATFLAAGQELDPAYLGVKSGKVLEASCYRGSKGSRYVRVLVHYDGDESPENDLYSLDRNLKCTETLLQRVRKGPVDVFYWKNYYLTVVADRLPLESAERSIREIEEGWAVKFASGLLALVGALICGMLWLRGRLSRMRPESTMRVPPS